MFLNIEPTFIPSVIDTESGPVAGTVKTSSELIKEHNALFESYYIDDIIQHSPLSPATTSAPPKRHQSKCTAGDTLDSTTGQTSSKTAPACSSRISECQMRSSDADNSISPFSLYKGPASNMVKKEAPVPVTKPSNGTKPSKMANPKSAKPIASILKLEKGKDPAMDPVIERTALIGKAPRMLSRPMLDLKRTSAHDGNLPVMLTKSSQSKSGNNKAAVLGPVTLSPITARKASITRTLRANKKYPKKVPASNISLEFDSEDDIDDNDIFDLYSSKTAFAHKKRNSNAAPNVDLTQVRKNQPKSVVPADYRGIDSNYGSSSNRPAGAKLTTPWRCAHRSCASGMTWWPREGKGSEGMGRKTISHYFGRNKKETNFIHPDVWHTVCRKDYQRLFYRARKSPGGVFPWHMSNLRMQFIRLRLWRPDALFKVQLTSKMKERAGVYHEALVTYNGDGVAAKATYDKHFNDGENRKPNKKGSIRPLNDEEAFPIEHYDEFKKHCCTTENTLMGYDGIEKVIKYIKLMRRQGKLTQMPPVEFLINEVQEGETVHDPATNYARWVAASDGEAYDVLPSLEANHDDDYDEESAGVKAECDEEPDDEYDDTAVKEEEESVAGSEIQVASGREVKSLLDSIDIEEEEFEVDEAVDTEGEEDTIKDPNEDVTRDDDEDEDIAPFSPVERPGYGGFRPRPGGVRHSSTYGVGWGSGNKRKREEAEVAAATAAAMAAATIKGGDDIEVKKYEDIGEEKLEFTPIVKKCRATSLS